MAWRKDDSLCFLLHTVQLRSVSSPAADQGGRARTNRSYARRLHLSLSLRSCVKKAVNVSQGVNSDTDAPRRVSRLLLRWKRIDDGTQMNDFRVLEPGRHIAQAGTQEEFRESTINLSGTARYLVLAVDQDTAMHKVDAPSARGSAMEHRIALPSHSDSGRPLCPAIPRKNAAREGYARSQSTVVFCRHLPRHPRWLTVARKIDILEGCGQCSGTIQRALMSARPIGK
ncbi:hypothetical protein BC628DRAFT_1341221 [Trametes gibbosa]|nr:hypothetical protein BC628DRAFT_1341221 [Trametes gibbosa]